MVCDVAEARKKNTQVYLAGHQDRVDEEMILFPTHKVNTTCENNAHTKKKLLKPRFRFAALDSCLEDTPDRSENGG